MRSLGTRRIALVTGTAAVAAVALAGCSAGQVAETSLKNPGIYGVDEQNSNASVLIRGLAVTYNSTQGYPVGADAPLEVNLYNQTASPVEVLVSSRPPADVTAKQGVTYARQVGLVGGTPSAGSSSIPEVPAGSRPAASPMTNEGNQGSVPSPNPSQNPSPGETPSTQPTPSGAAVRPARITIGPLGFVAFRPGYPESLRVVGLVGALKPGTSVNLVFEFSNGAQPLIAQAPMGIPLSPASRGPVNPAENREGETTGE
jgi:hypothetical protein